jgi:endoglucanase
MVDPAAGGWFVQQAAEMVALAQPALEAPTCQVRYQVHAQWNDGFITQVTVKNLTASRIDGWTLQWSFGGSETIREIWGADATQPASVVTATNERWNRFIAPGGLMTFGFLGNRGDAAVEPSYLFYLNGKACAVP